MNGFIITGENLEVCYDTYGDDVVLYDKEDYTIHGFDVVFEQENIKNKVLYIVKYYGEEHFIVVNSKRFDTLDSILYEAIEQQNIVVINWYLQIFDTRYVKDLVAAAYVNSIDLLELLKKHGYTNVSEEEKKTLLSHVVGKYHLFERQINEDVFNWIALNFDFSNVILDVKSIPDFGVSGIRFMKNNNIQFTVSEDVICELMAYDKNEIIEELKPCGFNFELTREREKIIINIKNKILYW